MLSRVFRKLVAVSLIVVSGWGSWSRRRRPCRRRRVPAGDNFYVPPHPLKNAKPGTIIRSTPIAAPAGARAWKVLYHSLPSTATTSPSPAWWSPPPVKRRVADGW